MKKFWVMLHIRDNSEDIDAESVENKNITHSNTNEKDI